MKGKVLLLSTICALSAQVLASEESMNSLGYRVKGKEFHYQTSVTSTKSKDTQVSGTNTFGFETTNLDWSNELSYGFSDDLSFGIAFETAISDKTKQVSEKSGSTVYTGSATKGTNTFSNLEAKDKGAGDIMLQSSYRFMKSDIKGDLLLGFAFSGSAEKSQVSNSSDPSYSSTEGDKKTGGSSILIGANFSGAKDAFEWTVGGGLTYKLKKKQTVLKGDTNASNVLINTDEETAAKADLAVNVGGQYNLTTAFSMGLGLDVLFVGEDKITGSTYGGNATKTAETTTVNSHTDAQLSVNGDYQLMSNLKLGLSYSHTFSPDLTGSNLSGTTTTAFTVNNVSADTFGMNLGFRF